MIEVSHAGEPRKAPSKGDLGTAIRELRTARGLSIEALALAADMHTTYLSGIEREIRNPSWEKLCSLADALDAPIAELTRHAEQIARTRRVTSLKAKDADREFSCQLGGQSGPKR